MSTLERLLVVSPVRAWLQRGEIAAFMRWGRVTSDACVLDMGCARGTSTRLIMRWLRPRCLSAFDLDPDMVERARRTLAREVAEGAVEIRAADATEMPYDDDLFDAVFESGVVHHVPAWRAALVEVARVLKPGGPFCFTEPSRGRLQRGLYRLLPHDPDSMFDETEWREALATAGLELEGSIRRLPLWDLCGVAVRA